jgi:hypothetical protein
MLKSSWAVASSPSLWQLAISPAATTTGARAVTSGDEEVRSEPQPTAVKTARRAKRNVRAALPALALVGSVALESPQPDECVTMNLDIYASDYRKTG